MTSKYRYIPSLVLIIGSMISIWFLICNLQTLYPAPYAFAVFLAISLYLALKVFNNDLLRTIKRRLLNLTKRKYFAVTALSVITIFGLLARLFFYFRFDYVPVSDPMTFYNSATTLASGGSVQGSVYVALFPYLAAYNNVLGVAARMITDPWLATILLNSVFDILSGLMIFTLLRKMLTPSSSLPVLAFGVWVLNPLNIIFSVLSLPIVIVNFFVVLTIFVSYLLIKQLTNLKTKNTLLLSVVLGLTLGFGNCFRPIFIVVIIALIIVGAFTFLTINKSTKFLKLFVASMSLSLLLFFGIQTLNTVLVSNQIGLHAAKNPAGWSMYVGSSYGTWGQWRQYHNDEMRVICDNSLPKGNYDECHRELQHLAIMRYTSLGISDLIRLFIHKLHHQAGQQNYFYNAEQSLIGYYGSRTSKAINTSMVIYMVALFTLSAVFLYLLAKQAISNRVISPILIFMTLIMIGWFFSFMFVESAPRYSTILYPIFVIFSVLMLDKIYIKRRHHAE